ncbi:sugar ABC transporter permease [Curtobacterium sp. A7_M15]|uniref:carbohydrate ABC transporter permease n=1 Tax=Curtobacterium sp. A7_M15 TaxID=3065241 RepID=UPI002737A998|nr:sugar ABC transporter permease [Curtobacterium sp. A7_M15]MDP4331955.1 sugar ABC transporter permease [Curtobacterium sp. A7_M15]
MTFSTEVTDQSDSVPVVAPTDRQRLRTRRPVPRRQAFTLAAFVVPAFILFGLFVIYPLVAGVRYSFYNWDGTGPLVNFIGLKNYAFALFDPSFAPQFWRAIGHNLYFFAMSMALTLVFGLGLAYCLLLVNERASQRYSIIMMLPFTLPPVAIAYIWTVYLEPNTGVLQTLLNNLHLDALALPFLGSTVLALPTIAVITAWVGMGFPVLVFLASMTDVPQDVMDAAALDGAGRFRILWSVLIPSIRPTLIMMTTMNFIGAFGTFDLIYIMEGSQAGPDYSTDVLGTLFYRTGFGGFGSTAQSMGLATALAVLGFIIVVAVSAVFLRLQKRFAD